MSDALINKFAFMLDLDSGSGHARVDTYTVFCKKEEKEKK
jgi:hypothetical protein